MLASKQHLHCRAQETKSQWDCGGGASTCRQEENKHKKKSFRARIIMPFELDRVRIIMAIFMLYPDIDQHRRVLKGPNRRVREPVAQRLFCASLLRIRNCVPPFWLSLSPEEPSSGAWILIGLCGDWRLEKRDAAFDAVLLLCHKRETLRLPLYGVRLLKGSYWAPLKASTTFLFAYSKTVGRRFRTRAPRVRYLESQSWWT